MKIINARIQARHHRLERFRNRTHRAADHSPSALGEIRADFPRVHLDVGQLEVVAYLHEELGSRSARLGQNQASVGPGDRERDSRQTRPGAHVYQWGGQFNVFQYQQAVCVMLDHHVFEVVDSCQVEPRIGGSEQLVIVPKAVDLIRRQNDTAALENCS
jgi:hypothetical protein